MREKNKKLRNKIISAVATVVLASTVCFCLFVVIQILGNGYVSIGGYSFFRIVTPSMEPNLNVDEVIITKNVPMAQVNTGDIISFKSQSADMFGIIITHRVVQIDTDENGDILFVTKGDANLSIDGRYVKKNNYVGKMIWSSGNSLISSVMAFVSSSYGFIACVILPTILLFILILNSSISNIKRNMNELVKALDKKEQSDNSDNNTITQEEYDQMYKKIRNELIEELKNSEDTKKHKTE